MQQFFGKPRMLRRITVLLLSTSMMGVGVAFFDQIGFGTDPCSVMNLALSRRIGWSYGNVLLTLNIVLFLLLMVLREGRRFGLGSLANMVLVGYSRDVFKPIVEQLLPGEVESLLVRGGVFIPTMALFLVAVAFYMVVELGTAPYDAISQIIAARLPKVPFALIRICFDIVVTIIGVLLGGKIGLFTVAACFFLGPVIQWIADKFRPWFN